MSFGFLRAAFEQLLCLALLTVVQQADAAVYIWQMDADEQQVNNCVPPSCDGDPADGSTNSSATGTAELVYETPADTISWDIAWSGLEHLLSAIHIHGPATPPVSNGAHIFDVFPKAPDVIAAGVDRTTDSDRGDADFSDIVAATGTFSQDAQLLLEVLTDDRAYVNIHTCDGLDPNGICVAGYPMGEIRAQLDLVHYELSPGELPSRAHERCATAIQDKLRRTTRTTSKFLLKCERKMARGDLGACDIANLQPKLDKLSGQTQAAYAKRCSGVDAALLLHRPPFGAPEPQGAADVVPAASDILILGDPVLIDGDPLPADVDPVASRCQLEGIKRVHGCIDAHQRAFRSCKQAGLRGGKPSKLPPGAADPFTTVADLDACLGFDPKGRLARACANKIDKTVNRTCEGVDPNLAFPGGSGDPASDLEDWARCLSCQAQQSVDGLTVDCDLFDDGADDGSCDP